LHTIKEIAKSILSTNMESTNNTNTSAEETKKPVQEERNFGGDT